MVEATNHHPAVGPVSQVDAGLLNVGYAEVGPGDGRVACCCTAGPTTSTATPRSPHEGGVGHNLPQEAPEAFANAVIEVDPS
jgi:hypothetical protein